jgi:hypothetical protein
MFCANGVALGADFGYYLQNFGVILLASVLTAMPIYKWLTGKIAGLRGFAKTAVNVVACVAGIALFTVTVSCLVADTYNPFLYFRF